MVPNLLQSVQRSSKILHEADRVINKYLLIGL
jgi:hypothetical protein